jgi:regulator of protease activity HflC (stomatin/prohibitin superfamily)
MAWIILSIILGMAAVAAYVLTPGIVRGALGERREYANEAGSAERAANVGRWLAVGLIVALWGLYTLVSSVRQVEAGHVGLVYEFGNIVGQRDAGLTLIAPWQGFRRADIRIQKVRAETDCAEGRFEECLEAFSSETQDVYIVGTVNISINPTDVQRLYRTVGPDYLNKIVRPRMAQRVKEETVKFKSIDIAPNREVIREAVRSSLTRDLGVHSINVDDFLLENIDFNPEFKAAIELKLAASQEALRQEELIAAREAEAAQKAATAQGEADRLRIEAEGQAAANRTISASLTPELIQFQAVQKLADNVQIALLPSGQGIIIDPSTLLQGPAAP